MSKVRESWTTRKELYKENWEIQLLRRELDQAEAWLTAREGLLSDPSYGVSKDSINAETICYMSWQFGLEIDQTNSEKQLKM